jgi:hypothetical protein
VGRGYGRVICCKYCTYKYVNEKMIPVKTSPGMWGGGIKENDGGVNSNMMYLIFCKNSGKCHSVPPPSITMKYFEK